MKAGPTVYALAGRVGVCALLALAATPQPFPSPSPVADGDPSVHHPAEVSLPARLSIQRTADRLSISYDPASLRTVKITIGSKMAVGFKDELRVYPEGGPRPEEHGLNEGSLPEHESAAPLWNPNVLNFTEVLNSARDGIPTQGKHYVIEHDLTVFETDIPAQHMWSPESGKKSRVLWEEKVKATS